MFYNDQYNSGVGTFQQIEGDYIMSRCPGSYHLPVRANPPAHLKFDLNYFIGIGAPPLKLHQMKVPFCFEFYPGFGWNPRNNKPLRQIVSNRFFEGMVVTSPYIKRFVEALPWVPKHKIFYKYGGFCHTEEIYNAAILTPNETPKVWLTACNYGSGYDRIKGFDVFRRMASRFKHLEFHHFGDFRAAGVRCYGRRKNNLHICQQYRLGDIFLSAGEPVRGQFDGFPTGAAIEAGLAGCVPLLTNPLDNNEHLVEGKEWIEVTRQNVADKLQEVVERGVEYRSEIALAFREKARKVWDNEAMWAFRKEMFEEVIRRTSQHHIPIL